MRAITRRGVEQIEEGKKRRKEFMAKMVSELKKEKEEMLKKRDDLKKEYREL